MFPVNGFASHTGWLNKINFKYLNCFTVYNAFYKDATFEGKLEFLNKTKL